MIGLEPWAWAALGVAAITIGISKTAIPGGNILAIALFAAVLPLVIYNIIQLRREREVR